MGVSERMQRPGVSTFDQAQNPVISDGDLDSIIPLPDQRSFVYSGIVGTFLAGEGPRDGAIVRSADLGYCGTAPQLLGFEHLGEGAVIEPREQVLFDAEDRHDSVAATFDLCNLTRPRFLRFGTFTRRYFRDIDLSPVYPPRASMILAIARLSDAFSQLFLVIRDRALWIVHKMPGKCLDIFIVIISGS